jgi:excisionase family DNA binding protein
MRLRLRSGRLADYLTVKETAEALNYHPEHVREMLREGRLRADKKSGIWLVYRDAVEGYREAVKGKSKHDPTRGS